MWEAWYNVVMGFKDWTVQNWFTLFQTGALAGGLLLIGVAVLLEGRARRVGNLIQLTEQHRDLWERMYSQPELTRILDPDADLPKTGITVLEERFVIFIILHLSSTYYAMRSGFFHKPHGLRKDIQLFFSLPIPRAVWKKVKALQEPAFVRFVEKCRPSPDLDAEE
jgi:hypothetical protein